MTHGTDPNQIDWKPKNSAHLCCRSVISLSTKAVCSFNFDLAAREHIHTIHFVHQVQKENFISIQFHSETPGKQEKCRIW